MITLESIDRETSSYHENDGSPISFAGEINYGSSLCTPIYCRVLQGFVRGPIMFIIYINYLNTASILHFVHFGNYITVFCKGSND